MSLIIENPGILSLLVDGGRKGYQRLGITVGGPADEFAFKWANTLCGNINAEVCIEIIGAGARFTAVQNCEISITGAVTAVKLKGDTHDGWQNFWLKAGESIEIQTAQNGLRSYLAVAGGFNIKTIFGSATTVVRDRLGGLNRKGSVLKIHDSLAFNLGQSFRSRILPRYSIPNYEKCRTLRIVAGYQVSLFSQAAITNFQNNQFKVSPQSDRMAVRFSGNPLKIGTKSMLSEGLCRGSVQIPPDGIPIVMLSDRQTMGGYPKIGTMLSCDCDVLCQIHSGNTIDFKLISVYKAQNVLQLNQQRFLKLSENI